MLEVLFRRGRLDNEGRIHAKCAVKHKRVTLFGRGLIHTPFIIKYELGVASIILFYSERVM
jgi:hypothetical protein